MKTVLRMLTCGLLLMAAVGCSEKQKTTTAAPERTPEKQKEKWADVACALYDIRPEYSGMLLAGRHANEEASVQWYLPRATRQRGDLDFMFGDDFGCASMITSSNKQMKAVLSRVDEPVIGAMGKIDLLTSRGARIIEVGEHDPQATSSNITVDAEGVGRYQCGPLLFLLRGEDVGAIRTTPGVFLALIECIEKSKQKQDNLPTTPPTVQ